MLLMSNVDDITNEEVPYIISELLNNGAKNVHVLPSITKKGRQEHIFFIDTPEEIANKIKKIFVRETGTIGIRMIKEEHTAYNYKIKNVKISISEKFYELKVKIIYDKEDNVLSTKVEYEDLKNIARQIKSFSFNELKSIIESEVIKILRHKKIKVDIDA